MATVGLPHRRDLEHVLRGVRARARKDAKHAWAVVLGAGIASIIVLVTVTNAAPTVAGLVPVLPPPDPLAQSTRVLDVKGRLIATLHGDQDRIVVKSFPRALENAVLAIEDADFYRHGGLQIDSIARALIVNTKSGQVVQGGSTITQQLVRNIYPSVGTERTLLRKAREAMLAMRYEQLHSKKEILRNYLNTVYFGNGAYGAEAAARTYFGKPARALRIPEAAYLAGLIHAPERYVFDEEAAVARRNHVLDRMRGRGFLTAKQLAPAKEAGLVLQARKATERAAYFVEHVRRVLLLPRARGGFGLTDKDILAGGLTVHTTLDLDMQRAAEKAVKSVLPFRDDPEAALVSMTSDGQIRALVGGRDFTSIARARGFNLATQIAPGGGRQSGSAFKPFTLAAYLREGYSVRKSFPAPSRVTVKACPNGNEPWSPSNYDKRGYGRIDALRATWDSVNTVYAQMVALAGPNNAVRAARDAGIVSDLQPYCAISLGVFGVTPLEMARAYSTFAAGGLRPEPLAVTKITDAQGKTLAARRVTTKRTFEKHIADQVNRALGGVVQNGTGRPAAISRPSAGKTGTTESRRDVWYVGYTPAPGLTTAVWIGYPPKNGRIKPMLSLHGRPATGGAFAGAIWRQYMSVATSDMPVRSFPDVEFTGARSGSVDVGYVRTRTRTTTRTDPDRRDEDPKPHRKRNDD